MAPRRNSGRRLLALGTCVGALLSLGSPARAEETFTFYGSGWGHGIGLSQYGAYGLAQEGWDAGRILR
ncbi:MAG TPA: hypothetical protein VEA19_03340, partial [Actinomycetota bacterium]|nr:hypothetical protein [Actinomycetota bacterium]